MAEEDESENLPGPSSLLCQPNLIGEEEEELDNLPGPYLQLTMTGRLYPSVISSLILIKWAHVQSESMASITTKSPPTKVIKAEPLSPDHNSLCKAMRVSGEANLDTMQCMSLFNALLIAHLIYYCYTKFSRIPSIRPTSIPFQHFLSSTFLRIQIYMCLTWTQRRK